MQTWVVKCSGTITKYFIFDFDLFLTTFSPKCAIRDELTQQTGGLEYMHQ